MKENNLIHGLIRENKDFFEKLVLENHDLIFNLVKNMVKASEQAEDIVQEVFLKAYRNLDKFKNGSKISTWLYSIARNETINRITRNRPKEEQMSQYDAENFPLSGNIQDESFIKAQEAEKFRKALENLGEGHRLILELRYLEEKPYIEIAQIMGLKINTVKVRLLRAKKALQKNLSQM